MNSFTLKPIAIALIVFFSIAPLSAQEKLEKHKIANLQGEKQSIEYTSPFVHIVIGDGQVLFTKIEDEYSKTSSIPSHHSVNTKTSAISSDETAELISYIEELGFMDLKNVYGAPDNVKHYTYTIKVNKSGVEKTVTYKSHPDHELEPDVFDQVEVFLREYIDGVSTWK